jgi:hypothetical protein
MNRSPRKKILKAKRAASRPAPDAKSGFRKLVVDGLVFHWRHHGDKVEIRRPKGPKYMVPVWELQGLTEDAWLKEHSECWEECYAYTVTPRMIRDVLFGKKAAAASAK